MGTTRSGKYLNTAGSARKVSDFALIHSSEGAFVKRMRKGKDKNKHPLRLDKGGHGQAGINLLDKYKIEYHIVKTYPNGVRVGNAPDHTDRRKRSGIGQAWFPATWSNKDIKRAGTHVAGLKHNRHVPDGKIVWGNYKGVRVGVIHTHGKIATIFPDKIQPSKHGGRK